MRCVASSCVKQRCAPLSRHKRASQPCKRKWKGWHQWRQPNCLSQRRATLLDAARRNAPQLNSTVHLMNSMPHRLDTSRYATWRLVPHLDSAQLNSTVHLVIRPMTHRAASYRSAPSCSALLRISPQLNSTVHLVISPPPHRASVRRTTTRRCAPQLNATVHLGISRMTPRTATHCAVARRTATQLNGSFGY